MNWRDILHPHKNNLLPINFNKKTIDITENDDVDLIIEYTNHSQIFPKCLCGETSFDCQVYYQDSWFIRTCTKCGLTQHYIKYTILKNAKEYFDVKAADENDNIIRISK